MAGALGTRRVVRSQRKCHAGRLPPPVATAGRSTAVERPLWSMRRYDRCWPILLKNAMLKWFFSGDSFSRSLLDRFKQALFPLFLLSAPTISPFAADSAQPLPAETHL